ncbi:MAG TPA: peptidoglycan DD-metalloendopeptidase family protein [Candidatus Eisenbacteria bacterium]
MPTTRRPKRAAGWNRPIALAILATFAVASSARADDGGQGAPIAGAFVYPVGDELDYAKPHAGEPGGFHVSDPYLVVRKNHKRVRVHRGVDLADGRGGSPVRAVASGEVIVADANALIKVRRKQRLRLPTVVNGKRVYRMSTRWRTGYKWRTGWGNYVVIRHTLPNGEAVFSLYAHLKPKSVLVKKGDIVAAGEPIALVGRTGRATSAHLHLEIRKSLPAEADADGIDDDLADAEAATVQDRSFAKLQTVDPVAFLEEHVRRFDDLDPASWEARYALAACRDGLLAGDGDRFDPDRAITRADYYRALVAAFRLATPFTTETFESSVDALVDSGLLDKDAARGLDAGDRIPRAEAVELLLRCLDKKPAQGRNLSAIPPVRLCGDFNRTFASADAAAAAEKEAFESARLETAARRKAADAAYAKALRAAKTSGAGAAKRRRVKRAVVKPVAPVVPLDPGFQQVSQSKKSLTRAEACLLLASALRLSPERVSALERAATRTATTATSG